MNNIVSVKFTANGKLLTEKRVRNPAANWVFSALNRGDYYAFTKRSVFIVREKTLGYVDDESEDLELHIQLELLAEKQD